MREPLISILVPVYGVEPYLKRCLDSIVNQTYHHLEIILVDDGSPDNSGRICDEYANRDARIKVIHQANKGVSAARNQTLDAAHGEYYLFVDSDDWIEARTCDSLLSIALEQHADLVCFGHEADSPVEGRAVIKTDCPGPISREELMRELIWGDGSNGTMLWNKFFSSSLFDGVRFVEGRIHEDLEIMPKLIHRADSIYVSDLVLYHYMRRTHGSITSGVFKPKSIVDRVYANMVRLSIIEAHYPDLADKQLAMVVRLRLVGLETLKGEVFFPSFKEECDVFFGRYRHRMKSLTTYSRLLWLNYYCKALVPLYIKWLRITNYNFNNF